MIDKKELLEIENEIDRVHQSNPILSISTPIFLAQTIDRFIKSFFDTLIKFQNETDQVVKINDILCNCFSQIIKWQSDKEQIDLYLKNTDLNKHFDELFRLSHDFVNVISTVFTALHRDFFTNGSIKDKKISIELPLYFLEYYYTEQKYHQVKPSLTVSDNFKKVKNELLEYFSINPFEFPKKLWKNALIAFKETQKQNHLLKSEIEIGGLKYSFYFDVFYSLSLWCDLWITDSIKRKFQFVKPYILKIDLINFISNLLDLPRSDVKSIIENYMEFRGERKTDVFMRPLIKNGNAYFWFPPMFLMINSEREYHKNIELFDKKSHDILTTYKEQVTIAQTKEKVQNIFPSIEIITGMKFNDLNTDIDLLLIDRSFNILVFEIKNYRLPRTLKEFLNIDSQFDKKNNLKDGLLKASEIQIPKIRNYIKRHSNVFNQEIIRRIKSFKSTKFKSISYAILSHYTLGTGTNELKEIDDSLIRVINLPILEELLIENNGDLQKVGLEINKGVYIENVLPKLQEIQYGDYIVSLDYK